MKKGIDVSYANGSIDWSKVKKSGIEFAILRSTFGSESASQIDSQYFQNATGCVKNNIPFATYHFAYFVNEKTAKDEADFAIKKANEYKKYVKFIVLDVEEDSVRYAKNMGYNPDWTACSITFMERIKSAGYTPVLYSNYNWLKNVFNYNKIKNYKLWYSAPDAKSPAYTCAIWQYSWKGKVNGINGDVDMNYLYDDSLFNMSNTVTKETSTKSSTNSTKTNKTNTQVTELGSSSTVNYSVKITSDNGVNIRAGASTTKAILGAVPYNTTLKVTKQTGGSGYTWGLITYNGITGWIALQYTKKIETTITFKKGDKVKVKNGAVVYGTNQKFSSFVYQTTYQIMEISGNRIVIGINGEVMSAIDKKYLTKV